MEHHEIIRPVPSRQNAASDVYIGEIDIQHRLRLRAAIDEEIKKSLECERDIRIGYEKSKNAWDRFWTNIFEAELAVAV